MKSRNLIILVAILAILGIVAFLKARRNNCNWQENHIENATTILSESFDVSSVTRISIKDNQRTITIIKDDNGWHLVEKDDYPANLQELGRLMSSLTDTKIAQTFTADEEQLKDMCLTDDMGAVHLELFDSTGKSLASFVFGKKIEASDGEDNPYAQMSAYGLSNGPLGRFIGIDGKYYGVANTFALLDEEISNWFSRDFIKVTALKSAVLSENDSVLWRISKEKQSDSFKLEGDIPDGMEIDSAKTSAAGSTFSWIRFNDVVPATTPMETVGMQSPKTLVLTEFNGNIYTVQIGSKLDAKQYIRISVAWNGPENRTPAEGETEEDKAKFDAEFAKSIDDSKKAAAELNAKLEPWYYEVGASALKSICIEHNDFLKKIQEEEPADK